MLEQLKKWLKMTPPRMELPPSKNGQLCSRKEALIPVFREKWEKISISTEPIDRQKVAEIVEKSYICLNRETPRIVFCESPASMRDTFFASGLNSLGFDLNGELERSLLEQLKRYGSADEFAVWKSTKTQWQYELERFPLERFPPFKVNFSDKIFDDALCDFCITVLNCSGSIGSRMPMLAVNILRTTQRAESLENS